MNTAQITLASAIGQALARHEGDESLDSLIVRDVDDPTIAWLDCERAGRIAAYALETTAGTAARVPAVEGVPSESGAPTPPVPGSDGNGLLRQNVVLRLHQTIPEANSRNPWLVDQMVALGRDRSKITISTFFELGTSDLVTLLERLAIRRAEVARTARRRGVRATPGSSA